MMYAILVIFKSHGKQHNLLSILFDIIRDQMAFICRCAPSKSDGESKTEEEWNKVWYASIWGGSSRPNLTDLQISRPVDKQTGFVLFLDSCRIPNMKLNEAEHSLSLRQSVSPDKLLIIKFSYSIILLRYMLFFNLQNGDIFAVLFCCI